MVRRFILSRGDGNILNLLKHEVISKIGEKEEPPISIEDKNKGL